MERNITTGIVAGLIAGITVELFLLAVSAASWPGTYQWIASGAAGKAAYESVTYAWIGLAMHFVISSAWGVLYVFLAPSYRALVTRPVLSGVLYGFGVFVVMQSVAGAAHIWSAPTAAQLSVYLIDHCVFFGIPLAFVVSRRYAVESRCSAVSAG